VTISSSTRVRISNGLSRGSMVVSSRRNLLLVPKVVIHGSFSKHVVFTSFAVMRKGAGDCMCRA
jgi:hypothetical protein